MTLRIQPHSESFATGAVEPSGSSSAVRETGLQHSFEMSLLSPSFTIPLVATTGYPPRQRAAALDGCMSFLELGGAWSFITSLVAGARSLASDEELPPHSDETVVSYLSDALEEIPQVALAQAGSIVQCAYGRVADVAGRAVTGVVRKVSRPFEEVSCYPEVGVSRIGDGLLLDGEEYVQGLCLGCSSHLVDALATPLADCHTCHVLLPSCCRRCRPGFQGLTSGEIELRTFFFPSELYHVWAAMGQLKRGHTKKNYHVGWTTTVEAHCRDNGGWNDRREALLHFLPAITRLQAMPSVCVPRWVAGLPDGRVRDFFWHFTHRYPHDMACCATLWRREPCVGGAAAVSAPPSGAMPLAVTQATMTDVDIDASDGVVPARAVVVTQADVDQVGIQGLTLPSALPSAGPAETTADGRHEYTDAEVARRIAPILGTPCVYDPDDQRNLVSVIRDRVGGQRAELRKNKFAPSNAHKAEVARILQLLKTEWFTAERVLEWVLELGTLDQMFDPKLSEQAARNMITEIQAGHELPDKVPWMIKRECTANPGKAPRGICDPGLHNFVASAQVLKVIEHGLTLLDAPSNIKHRPKAAVLDEIADICSSRTTPDLPRDTFRVVECDHSTYEWTQSLEFQCAQVGAAFHWRVDGVNEADLGVLSYERDLIRHVSGLMPKVLTELYAEMIRRTLSPDTKVTFVPKVKQDASTFGRCNWRLVMFLRARLSGDGQTSWGNRFHNLLVMSVVTLKRGRDYWRRLLDLATGKRPPGAVRDPKTWIFESASGGRGHRLYWRVWGEGDDFKAHTAGDPALVGKPDVCDLDDPALKQWLNVRTGLETFGFSPKLVVRRDGRSEFVGAHFLLEGGFTIPGAWVPDICRGLVTSAVGVTKALDGLTAASCAQISLAMLARADMFRGRNDPMCAHYESYSDDWWDQACRGSRGSDESTELSREMQLSWAMAEILGKKYQERITVGDARRALKCQESLSLDQGLQRRLAAASVEGPITWAEWGFWSAARPCINDDPSDVLASLPAVIRKRLS